MAKRKQDEIKHDDGTYVVKKSRKGNIASFILCALIALIIWLYATNDEQKKLQEQEQQQQQTTAAVTAVVSDCAL